MHLNKMSVTRIRNQTENARLVKLDVFTEVLHILAAIFFTGVDAFFDLWDFVLIHS